MSYDQDVTPEKAAAWLADMQGVRTPSRAALARKVVEQAQQLRTVKTLRGRPTTDGLDLAAVKGRHEGPHYCLRSDDWSERVIAAEGPCLPYRLASLALDLHSKVARVQAERDGWQERGSKQGMLVRWWRRRRAYMISWQAAVQTLDRALSDRPEQVQS